MNRQMDTAEGAKGWDRRYLAGEFGSPEPDAFVTEAHIHYLLPLLPAASTGLDLAGGAGRHAVWLTRQGWRMSLADWSEAALNIARQRVSGLPADASVEILQGPVLETVEHLRQADRRFGFLLISFFLDRTVLPLLPELLLLGGLLLYRTYTEDNERLGNPRGPRDPEYLLRSQELLDTFRGMKILHYNETVANKGVVEMIAQRQVG